MGVGEDEHREIGFRGLGTVETEDHQEGQWVMMPCLPCKERHAVLWCSCKFNYINN